MASNVRALLDWIDSRTNYQTGRKHLLDEPLPPNVGWWFITGAVLMFLLGVQFLTGLVLAMYYVSSPELAYDSVRFITDRLPFGRVVRGLHFFGASFIVVAAVVHMLRVVLFASYKKPREVTWITGVVLLLIILGFALTGYLLPWDQKAYWATTVTINIARGAPLIGEQVASVMRAGYELGALTLGRWYSVHVFLLPAALIGFVVAHVYLMRRHGISGALAPVAGAAKPFYPYHALKDTIAIAVVFAALLALAMTVEAPLDEMADPSDATYIPRPEWYFLSLFQLLKYFPGPLEPVASMVIPGILLTALLLLPFLDRTPERHPLRRPVVTSAFVVIGACVVVLTWLGLQDSRVRADPSLWGPLAIAGREFSTNETCAECHRAGGVAPELTATRVRHDLEWFMSHAADPEVIAPGLRKPPEAGMNRPRARAVWSYMRKVRAGVPAPVVSAEVQTASRVFASRCSSCHAVDGEGDAAAGGDLSQAGREHDAKWLREWITDPAAVDETAEVPAFGDRLSDEEMTAIVNYLARRK
jgi:ubiquinol-cytochrome c reductase cytochrome b subunit